MDDIIARLQALTVANLATTPPLLPTIDNLKHALNQLTLGDIGQLSPHPLLSSPGIPVGSLPPDGDLKRLGLLDEKLEAHMKSILRSLDALSSPDLYSQRGIEVDLLQEKRYLQDSIRELHRLENHGDSEIHVLANAMHDRMAQFTSAIDFYIETLQRRSPPQASSHIVNTGDIILPTYSFFNLTLSLDSYFAPNLCRKHTPSLVAVLNIVAQNLFGHTTCSWCNVNLRSHKLFWEEMMTDGGLIPSNRDMKLHANFPTDLRTARQSLQIEPDTTQYAACSACCNVYPPKRMAKLWNGPQSAPGTNSRTRHHALSP